MRILHLSDLHLGGTEQSARALHGLLEDLAELPGLSAVVVTGDVADDGSVAAYASAREAVGGFAARRGIPAVFGVGNHDERTAFTAVLGSGHLDPAGADLAERVFDSPGGERAAVSRVGGLRLVTLDPLVPGKGYGLLGPAQLDWLREVLAEPAPDGTVLAVHHPPIALDVEVQRRLGLQDAAELAEAIRGSDVRLVLCGHFHLQLAGQLAGVPVWVTPGVASRVDLGATPGTERAVRGASAGLIQLDPGAAPLCHTLHARDRWAGELLYELDEPALREVMDRLGVPAGAGRAAATAQPATPFDGYERRAWAGRGPAYAGSFAKLCAGAVPELLDAAGVGAGDRVLDVGTGPGTVAAAAVARAAQVTAVDAEPSMVELARAAAPEAVVRLGMLPGLPCADESFDAVVGNFVLNHVGRPAEALAELRRVARPGGRIALTIWSEPAAAGQTLLGRAVAAAGITRPDHLPRLAAEHDFPRTPDGLAALLASVGWREVECTELRWDHRADREEWWEGAAAGVGFVGQLLLGQSESVRQEVRRHYLGLSREFAGPDGLLALPHAALLVRGRR